MAAMWNFFGKGYKEHAEEDEGNALSLGTGPVDMTTLDITYITHRLLGECLQRCCCC